MENLFNFQGRILHQYFPHKAIFLLTSNMYSKFVEMVCAIRLDLVMLSNVLTLSVLFRLSVIGTQNLEGHQGLYLYLHKL